jgi:hypothetical protein
MSLDFNFDEVYGLTADLTDIPKVMNGKVQQAIQQAGLRTKESWANDAKSGPRGDRYAPTIDYEAREFGAFGQGQYTVDIGPNLARYGGDTGKGGLVPSFGFLDDPQSRGSVKTPPSRSRPRAEKFGADELAKGVEIAIEQSMRAKGF